MALKFVSWMAIGLAVAVSVSCGFGSNSGSKGLDDDVVVDPVPSPPRMLAGRIVDTKGLRHYYPSFSKMDLVIGSMPEKSDTNVLFVCAAAFTGLETQENVHQMIGGHHVSGGVFFQGYKCQPNNGCFTWDSKTGWHFSRDFFVSSQKPLKKAAGRGGMGFCQNLIINNGTVGKTCISSDKADIYRALCELNGELCIIECTENLPYSVFVSRLKDEGVTYAMYLDMGSCRYSWYRDGEGKPVDVFLQSSAGTNWIVFYK